MEPPLSSLLARASGLAQDGRALLGIAGAPGAGKSTLAAELVERLGNSGVPAALVPMDGFHLPQAELMRRGTRDVMGRIDTFDADGYLTLLSRLRAAGGTVTAPGFDRSIEEPVPDAIAVGPDVALVVTEGNYLLDDEQPWPDVRATLDEVWAVRVDEQERLRRLHDRHVRFGKSEDETRAWMARVDAPNAQRIEAALDAADLLVVGG